MLRARLGSVVAPASGTDPLVEALDGAPSRLGVPVVDDRAGWAAVPPAVRDGLVDEARAALAEPWPVLLASDWARTFRDGVRTAWEDPAETLRWRATRLVLGAVLTGEVADRTAGPGAVPLLDGAVDALVALAEASTWCWAPHDGFTAARHEVLPDPDDPYLDLGAAEVCTLLAWADHVLGPHLDARAPGLRRRLRREVDRRVLAPFERRRDWPWIGLDGSASNWNPWIHGAVLTAALLLVDDDGARRAGLVRLVVDGLDHYLATLPADGGIDEGIAYWWKGAARLLEALDLLAAASPALDARDLPLLAELARFPYRMHLGADWYVNAGDAAARVPTDQHWQLLHAWSTRLGDPRVRAHALASARSGPPARSSAGLGRALLALSNQPWLDAHATPPAQPASAEPAAATPAQLPEASAPASAGWLERKVWLPGVEVLVTRERDGDLAGLTMAAKAGHNREHHNHLDVGTYWVAVDGRPVVVDAGQPTYTATSFTDRRYEQWSVHSAWHNVPEPGAAQVPGLAHAARDVQVEDGARVTGLSCELAAAYPAGQVESWRRGVRLVRDQLGEAVAGNGGRGAEVVVEDRWVGGPPVVLVRHLLAGEVELAGDGTGALVRPASGRAVRVSWAAGRAAGHREAAEPSASGRIAEPSASGRITATVERRELDDPLLVRSWGSGLTRLTLAVEGGAGELAVRIAVA